MHQKLLILCLSVLLPTVSTLIRPSFVLAQNPTTVVNDFGAVVIVIALLKIFYLICAGTLPLDLNDFFKSKHGIAKRSVTDLIEISNHLFYKHLDVEMMPCTRNFLCEVEMFARTSDYYLPRGPAVSYDKDPDEDVAPEQVNPLSELEMEAIRALFREDDSTGDLSPGGQRAMEISRAFTGLSCEKAYKLCPERHSMRQLYRTIFNELNLFLQTND